jgi:hypothetical protein
MNVLVPIEEPVVARQPADLLAGRWNIAMALTSKGYAGSMSDGSQAGMELLPPQVRAIIADAIWRTRTS